MNKVVKAKVFRGFTLIEVMVAMAVFAIAGTALLSSAGANFEHMSRLESRAIAGWVASNQLVAATLDHTWPPRNEQKGEVDMAGHQWHWLQKVLQTNDKNMRAIVLEVRAEEKDKQALVSLMTYVSKREGEAGKGL